MSTRSTTLAFALLFSGCATGADEVADVPSDASVVQDSVAVDVRPDIAETSIASDATDTAVDAVVASDAACADDCAASGTTCDPTSGKCVGCTAASDICPPTQHCDETTKTCVAGCKSDLGCIAIPNRSYCDTSNHLCVQCVADEHCPPGSLCLVKACAAGCSATQACPSGQSCCSGACVNLVTSNAHCGMCGTPCTAPVANGTPACISSACGIGACNDGFKDCANGATDGCESDVRFDRAKCGSCTNVCSADQTCVAGACITAKSCQEILALAASAPSGRYVIKPDGSDAFEAYCEMTSDGGGWTLAMKLDGAQPTFAYGSAYWIDATLLNATSADLSQTEAKLAPFVSVPFTALRLGMIDAGSSRFIVVPASAPSLRSRFSASGHVATTVSPSAWRSLLASPSLQPSCNLEGTNVAVAAYASVRIGILGNNEPECVSPDSFIGFGAGPVTCRGNAAIPTTGNVASCGGDQGDRVTATFGYVFVR